MGIAVVPGLHRVVPECVAHRGGSPWVEIAGWGKWRPPLRGRRRIPRCAKIGPTRRRGPSRHAGASAWIPGRHAGGGRRITVSMPIGVRVISPRSGDVVRARAFGRCAVTASLAALRLILKSRGGSRVPPALARVGALALASVGGTLIRPFAQLRLPPERDGESSPGRTSSFSCSSRAVYDGDSFSILSIFLFTTSRGRATDATHPARPQAPGTGMQSFGLSCRSSGPPLPQSRAGANQSKGSRRI